jgi:pimeloyl-ACP methyl ester carboxylesterase
MPTSLDPDGGFVEAGGILLATPGVTGLAEVVPPTAGDTRAGTYVSDLVASALIAAEMRVQADVELIDLSIGAGGPAGRGGGEEEPVLVARIPSPGSARGQVVLLVDEDGVLSWHDPESQPVASGTTRGGELLTYHLPVRRPVDTGRGRGPVGWLGKKVLKVLVFRLLDDALGKAGSYVAGRWERSNRWYDLRTVDVGSGLSGRPVDWSALTSGPALLLVHGTFSRGATAFSGLSTETLRSLVESYAGRVVVFDHPTVSVDPVANAQWLADQLVAHTPGDAGLVLDVVAHSRGGLVARTLAEQHNRLDLKGRRLAVHSAVHVGVPNAGTTLADTEHLNTLLDTYTNLLDLFPDVGVVDVLQVVLETVKQVATGVAEGLEGLMSMNPGGAFLRRLNASPRERATYAGVAADFTPPQGDARQLALNLVADRLFGRPNDLVVPRDGTWEVDGSALVPSNRRLSISPEAAVTHNGYFASPEVQKHLVEWLRGSA